MKNISPPPLSNESLDFKKSANSKHHIQLATDEDEKIGKTAEVSGSEKFRRQLRQRQKRSYNKISFEQLRMLKGFFSKNVYPARCDIEKLSLELGLCYIKIDNWFKHNRRLNVQKGLLKYSKKRNFTNEEVKLLKEYLEGKDLLTQATYRKIAKQFGCNENNIKNWFSYHRRKLRGSGDCSQSSQKASQFEGESNESFFVESEDSQNQETTIPSNEKSEKKSIASAEDNLSFFKGEKPLVKITKEETFTKTGESPNESSINKMITENINKYFTDVAEQTSSLLQKNSEEITNLKNIISKISQNLISVQNENTLLRSYQETLKLYLLQQQLNSQQNITIQPSPIQPQHPISSPNSSIHNGNPFFRPSLSHQNYFLRPGF